MEIEQKRLKELIKDSAKNLSTINIMLKNGLISIDDLNEFIANSIIIGESNISKSEIILC